jgi:hypothetical protein
MQHDGEALPQSKSFDAARPDAAPLRGVELLVIAVVWAFCGSRERRRLGRARAADDRAP